MNVKIRRAAKCDLQTIVEMSIKLSRQHQNYNALRFIQTPDIVQQHFDLFRHEIENPESVVLAAEHESQVIGYAFIRLEEGNVVDVSEKSAWLHDIFVGESARGLKAGKMLLEQSFEAAKTMGSRVLKLQVATQNEFARKLFETYKFQPTMTEMILDLTKIS